VERLAEHYGVAVVPARARKPRAKVEVGVQVVERWILAPLRNRQFFSLGELNTAISVLIASTIGPSRSYRIELKGESMRRRSTKLTTVGTSD